MEVLDEDVNSQCLVSLGCLLRMKTFRLQRREGEYEINLIQLVNKVSYSINELAHSHIEIAGFKA
jgi:hypothetical protein